MMKINLPGCWQQELLEQPGRLRAGVVEGVGVEAGDAREEVEVTVRRNDTGKVIVVHHGNMDQIADGYTWSIMALMG
jgi:hydroxyethylthiazole kinase-like sugar kinase family protein